MSEKEKFDIESPETKKLIGEIIHGGFVKEGTMVTFGLCFPGATMPIPADESHITALDITEDGIVYGGTSGRASHLFVGMFHGVTGMVFDMGVVEGMNRCAAICCGKEEFVACLNGKAGSRIVSRKFEALPFDCIQEWGFRREPFEDLGEPVAGEMVVHAVVDGSRRFVVGTTERHLFCVDIEKGKVEIVGEVAGSGRLAVGSEGNVFGLDAGESLWRFNPADRMLARKVVKLPQGMWDGAQLRWAKDPVDGKLYVADGDGFIFSFTEDTGFSGRLGQVAVRPVGPMAVTSDGRVFGVCGDGIGRIFCYNPEGKEVTDLGAVVSVIQRRRYGYVFADAVMGRDGQIFFGEDDDLGHLWIYFPAIQRRKS